MTEQATTTDELAFIRPYGEQEKQILTAEAVEFLTELVTHFTPQRNKLLAARIQQQQDIDNGTLPDFISETASIRDTDWKIRGIPADLQDRRVEITGPVERKMVINALNANVKVFMADFEDSLAPDWNKVIDGQINLRDAVNGTISYTNEAGKIYQLKPNPAVLICRVRGLHLPEKHVTWRGEAIPGSLFDFALYFFHNYQALLAKGSGPYFYLPKTQSWQEAAWWSEVFSYAEDRFNLPRGTIKATLLIETLPAVFQMEIGTAALCQQCLIVVEEIERKIKQATGDCLTTPGDMFFRQVQTAYPTNQNRWIGLELINFACFIGIADGAVNRIAQVNLPVDHFVPVWCQ